MHQIYVLQVGDSSICKGGGSCQSGFKTNFFFNKPSKLIDPKAVFVFCRST